MFRLTEMTLEKTIEAAEGYLELGLQEEALAELDSLPREHQTQSPVLQTRISILLQLRRWREALVLSEQLCSAYPSEGFGFIHAAFCWHELGETHRAKSLLLSGPPSLLDEALYYYNLGCYDAILGNLDQARAYLRASFRLNKAFREAARQDPDLAVLQGSL
jgi:tetratricopeptide (TPR) repeat protein